MSLAILERAFATARPHVVPFFVLGDPDPETSLALIRAAVDAGAGQIELGIPYSDPVADGPAIQAAGLRARAAGTTVASAIELLGRVRDAVEVPLNLLVYANLVHARGAAAFTRDVAAAGASSLLVPDALHEESPSLRDACRSAGLGSVAFLGPRTDVERARTLCAPPTAFAYLAGVQGVTGADVRGAPPASAAPLARALEVPLAVGFGVRTPVDVRAVLETGARLAVVGSALAREIEDGVARTTSRAALVDSISERVAELVTALSPRPR